MDFTNYQTTICVCVLQNNLEMMEFGDRAEIREKGINLSGGKKR